MTRHPTLSSFAILRGVLLAFLILPAAQGSGPAKTHSEPVAQNDSAMEILPARRRLTANWARANSTSLFRSWNTAAKGSSASAVRRPGFDQIDQHVQSAAIAREERYIQQGQPVAIVIVRVTRNKWPEGTCPAPGLPCTASIRKLLRCTRSVRTPGTRRRSPSTAASRLPRARRVRA